MIHLLLLSTGLPLERLRPVLRRNLQEKLQRPLRAVLQVRRKLLNVHRLHWLPAVRYWLQSNLRRRHRPKELREDGPSLRRLR